MNFLGHCLFSEQTPSALTGSLWPDFGLRPKTQASKAFLFHFDQHQLIDKFTDQCQELEPLRRELRPIFRKTTPVVIDVLIDYFLASQWQNIHDQSLSEFAQSCYQNLALFDEFPVNDRFDKTRFWMREHDWFSAYATEPGIEQALKGISRRINFSNPLSSQAHLACSMAMTFDDNLMQYYTSLKQTLAEPESRS